MKGFLGILAGLAASAVAFAAPIGASGPLAGTVTGQLDGGTSSRASVTIYDNWTSPGSALVGAFVAGTDEIADDCTTTGGGLLTSMGFNIGNANGATGTTLTGGQVAIRFYDLGTGNFISGFNANLPALSLAPGSYSRISFADGALDSLNINIPATGVYVSTQVNSTTWTGGGTSANVGYELKAPILVGSSADVLFDVTTASSFNFGGNPKANTAYFLHVAVPEPTSLALLALGGLLGLRRR